MKIEGFKRKMQLISIWQANDIASNLLSCTKKIFEFGNIR